MYTRYIYLCVCVCVYIYLYICKYKRLKIIARDNFLIPPLTRPLSLHICKRTLIYIHLNLYWYIYVYVHMYMNVCIHAFISLMDIRLLYKNTQVCDMHKYESICMVIFVCTRVRTHMCISHTYITHMHLHYNVYYTTNSQDYICVWTHMGISHTYICIRTFTTQPMAKTRRTNPLRHAIYTTHLWACVCARAELISRSWQSEVR